MRKIERLDSLPPNFLSRIKGGSTPIYFHIRFVGKSPSLLKPATYDNSMDYMIANEFICYGLANLVVGVNVPEHFLSLYEGNQYFFSRDIDPRPDSESGIFYAPIEQLKALDSAEVHLASAFNVWILNRDASQNRNAVIVDGKLYLIDFGNALFGVKKDEWQNWFEGYTTEKKNSRAILYNWIELNPEKFKFASEKIASIPDRDIDLVLKNALHLKLVNEEEYTGARDFLISRKSKLWELI